MCSWSDEELESQVGQLFVCGFQAQEPDEHIRTLIEIHKVSSVILYQRNVSTAGQLRRLTDSLQDIAKAAGHAQPLIITIDQENGRVTRIKSPTAAQLPGSMALGATGDLQNVSNVAGATAEMLKSLGINMTYACVADVNSEPKNPVIGVRSFSDDPDTVARFVTTQFKAYQDGGVVPCVKHFPGHGDTAVDSHFGLPIINKDRKELDACELLPFKMAVKEGVDAVMTAHIALPKLQDDMNADMHLPASLNPSAISILRHEMRFEGLILSDCLEMDGVRATYGEAQAAVMALKAGTDCVLVCHTLSVQISAIEAVKAAIRSGALSQDHIEASVGRVKALKTKYLSSSNSTIPPESFWSHLYRQQKDLAKQTYDLSATLVRASPCIIPLHRHADSKLILLYSEDVDLKGDVVAIGEEAIKPSLSFEEAQPTYLSLLRGKTRTVKAITYNKSTSFSTILQDQINQEDTVILITQNANSSPHQRELGLRLGKLLRDRLVVIATCDPYDFLEDEEEVRNYITIYEPNVEAFGAAVRLLDGEIDAKAILPVRSKKLGMS